MPREIINITMDQLPHASSSNSPWTNGSGSPNGLLYHTTTMTSLPIPISDPNLPKAHSTQASSSTSVSVSGGGGGSGSGSRTNTSNQRPQPPRRPSFGPRQRFNMTWTQLASHMAVAQAQLHKPKRPSPLHVSVSPESMDSDLSSASSSSSSSSSSSDGSCSDTGDIGGKSLAPISEERDNGGLGNMLGLDLKGWSWNCERQERMKEPRTPFPSPAIMF